MKHLILIPIMLSSFAFANTPSDEVNIFTSLESNSNLDKITQQNLNTSALFNPEDYDAINVSDLSFNKISKASNIYLSINGTDLNITPIIHEKNLDGSTTVSGYFSDFGPSYTATFTHSEGGLIGDYSLPEGQYKSTRINNTDILIKPH